MTGIYKIENLVNNKVYIGQAINIENRWKGHKKELHNNNHANKHLQNAWNKYGEENFKFEVIEECNENELNEKEIYWITEFGGLNSNTIYNKRAGGNSGGKLSNETKQKLSIINTNPINRKVWVKKDNYCTMIYEYDLQKYLQDGYTRGRVVNWEAWNKGIPMSDEQKQHLREINLGKPSNISDEKREQKRIMWLGKNNPSSKGLSNETKEKIRQANLGKKQSKITKEKRSKSMRLNWAKRKNDISK